MSDRVLGWLRASTALLVFSGYLALTTVRGYPTALLLIPALLIALCPLAERVDARFPIYRSVTRAVTIAFGCFIPLMWFSLGMLDGVIALTIFIQAYTMLHRKDERNYYHLFLMALFLLLAASVQQPEPAIGIVMALFLIGGTWSFLALRIHEELRIHGGNAIARVMEAPGGAPAPARPASPFDAGLIATVTLLSFGSVLLTALLFFLTPGIEAGVLGRNNATIAQTGISQTVDLTGGMFVQEDPSPVMHVGFPGEPGGRYSGDRDMYWRVSTLPRYVRSRWERRSISAHYEPGVPPLFPADFGHAFRDNDPLAVEREPRPGARLIAQRVYMDDVPEQGIPALDRVVSLRVEGRPRNTKVSWDGNQDFTVNLTTNGARRITYEAESEVRRADAAALREADPDYAAHMDERDLQLLTYHELLPQTQELVRRVVADAPTPYDQATALQAWLSGPDFEYSLSLPPLPNVYAIDSFINQVRLGHCELFASALALMLRSLDIPTRVVSGYRGGEWSDPDGAYVVRASMAHLWVEVYFVGHGWVVFDPSPRAADDAASALGQFRKWISWAGLRAKMFWYQQVVGFDRTVQLQRARDFSLGLVRWFQGLDGDTAVAAGPHRGIPWREIALGAAMLGGLALLWRLRRDADPVQTLTPDQARAVRLYRRLGRILARLGIPVRGRSAEEVLGACAGHPLIDRDGVAAVVLAYQETRFGMRPLSRAEYTRLARQVRALGRMRA